MPKDKAGNDYDSHDTQGREPVEWGKQQGDTLKMLAWAVGLTVVLGLLEYARRLFIQ